MTSEEQIQQHIESLCEIEKMLEYEHLEKMKRLIGACVAGETALRASIEGGQQVSLKTIEKIKAEIKRNIEEDDFARSVYLQEEKDKRAASRCEGKIVAYEYVLKIIDSYVKKENSE